MELVETAVPELSRRSRSMLVRHRATGLPRRLEAGEEVVLRDPATGDHWTGTVVDVHLVREEPDQPDYRVELGARLPEEHALARLGEVTGHEALFSEEQVDVHDLLNLLGAVRRAERRPAASRHSVL
ncbi:MAG: hypothetical protein Q8Q02_02570 [Nocardioides sp.]|nr:hypothetical protein [Nocardioides sp.]